jgi:signal peptidase II
VLLRSILRSRAGPLGVAVLISLLDRFSKLRIEHSFGTFDVIPLIPNLLRVVHTENPGAAFGVLADGNPLVRSVILIGVSALVLVFVASALWTRGQAYTAVLTRLGLAFIFGGAVGNLYDRILRGTVTDFIEVYHGDWSFPAFNVADSAITVGACLLLIELLRPHPKRLAEGSAGS